MVVSFKQFRDRYPTATMVSDLLVLHDEQFVIKVTIQIPEVGTVTGMAADSQLEVAEDRARQRALEGLGLEEAIDRPILSGLSLPTPISAPVALKEPTTQAKTIEDVADFAAPSLPPEVNFASEVNSFEAAKTALQVQEKAKPKAITRRTEEPVTASPTTLEKDISPEKVAVSPAKIVSPEELSPLEPEMLPSPVNLSDVIAQTDVELRRLGWSVADGREYLESAYGKRSRHDLTDEELLAFLLHLESLSHPDASG